MGLYVNSPQGLQMISGRGKAEYGASTIRKGTYSFTNTSEADWRYTTVTFDTPMVDTDYEIILTPSVGTTSRQAMSTAYTIDNKTINGFRISYYDTTATSNVGGNYTAFKLYTDLEYNGLLKLSRPDLWPVDTEIDLGDGLYGKRYTGIWSGAGTSVLLDGTIKSPNCKLIDYKTWQQRRDYSDYLQLLGCTYNDGSTRASVQLANTGLYVNHSWSSASDYDIWIKYTKTT